MKTQYYFMLIMLSMLSTSYAQTFSVGNNHAIMLCNGTVKTWGSNSNGQLGNGNNNSVMSPSDISITNVIAVGASKWNTIALKNDGTVWTWGSNDQGALGNGSSVANSNVPVQVSGLTNVSAIAAGGFFYFLALKSDGTVWTWGKGLAGNSNSNVPVQVSGLSNVIAIAAGEYHALAVTSDGNVWAWGDNMDGQLGDGTDINRNNPVQVSGLSGIVKVFANKSNNAGASGADSYALKADGTLWVWGKNNSGQLGIGSYSSTNIPMQSQITNVQNIAVGSAHTVAVKTDGTVWAWGHNFNGQITGSIGIPFNTPFQISGVSNGIDVFAGTTQSYALLSDGSFQVWGYNNDGLLGNSTANWNAATMTTGDQLCANTISVESFDADPNIFTVFPNPNNGSFVIQTDNKTVYELFDITGKPIQEFEVNGSTRVQENFAPGMYFLKRKNGAEYQKVIIQP